MGLQRYASGRRYALLTGPPPPPNLALPQATPPFPRPQTAWDRDGAHPFVTPPPPRVRTHRPHSDCEGAAFTARACARALAPGLLLSRGGGGGGEGVLDPKLGVPKMA